MMLEESKRSCFLTRPPSRRSLACLPSRLCRAITCSDNRQSSSWQETQVNIKNVLWIGILSPLLFWKLPFLFMKRSHPPHTFLPNVTLQLTSMLLTQCSFFSPISDYPALALLMPVPSLFLTCSLFPVPPTFSTDNLFSFHRHLNTLHLI